MMKCQIEHSSPEKKMNMNILNDKRKAHIGKNYKEETIFDDYIMFIKANPNNEPILPHENSREIFL